MNGDRVRIHPPAIVTGESPPGHHRRWMGDREGPRGDATLRVAAVRPVQGVILTEGEQDGRLVLSGMLDAQRSKEAPDRGREPFVEGSCKDARDHVRQLKSRTLSRGREGDASR
jgi:hypothetical protein